MYPEMLKKLHAEFDGRPPSDALEREVNQRLKQLEPDRRLYAVWAGGRITGVMEDIKGVFAQEHTDEG